MPFLILLMFVVGFLVYFAPAIVAYRRPLQSRIRTGILLLNIFLGWTAIGWVAALVWASSAAPAAKEQTATTTS